MNFSQTPPPKVVVTGMGAVSAFGVGLQALIDGLQRGESAVKDITLFDTSGCLSHRAAQLAEIEHGPIARSAKMALLAIDEAMTGADLKHLEDGLGANRAAVSLSTTGGSMHFFENYIREKIQGQPLIGKEVAHYHPQRQTHDILSYLNYQGPSSLVANACASGGNAIGHGRDLILAGLADRVLVGAFEELSELIFVGFDRLQSVTQTSCRSFDKERDGLILGEGAAFLVLESESLARQRGASVIAEICGYGHTTDTHHVTQPHPQGTALVGAITTATRQSESLGYRPSEIGYVNAHGTATPANDQIEASVLDTFLKTVHSNASVSSTKPAIGHTLGAAGAIEACICLATMQGRCLPPQINTTQPIEVIAERLVAVGTTPKPLQQVLNVNLGFGGSNCALLFRRYEG